MHGALLRTSTFNRRKIKVKVKFALEQVMKARRGLEIKLYFFFLTSALDEGEWSKTCSGRFAPGKDSRYPFYRRLGGPVWKGAENVAPKTQARKV
jgi:hypothetical protein